MTSVSCLVWDCAGCCYDVSCLFLDCVRCCYDISPLILDCVGYCYDASFFLGGGGGEGRGTVLYAVMTSHVCLGTVNDDFSLFWGVCWLLL